MVLPPEEIKVPDKKVVTLPVSEKQLEEPVGPVATVDHDFESKLEQVSYNTALTVQAEESKIGQSLRRHLGDANIVLF